MDIANVSPGSGAIKVAIVSEAVGRTNRGVLCGAARYPIPSQHSGDLNMTLGVSSKRLNVTNSYSEDCIYIF